MDNVKLREEPERVSRTGAVGEVVMERTKGPFLASVVRKLAIANLLYPFVLVAAFYAMWVAGRWELGHWPRPNFDDPARIGGLVDIFDYAMAFIVLAGFPAVCVSHAVSAALLSGKPAYRTRGVVLFEALALVSLGLLFLFVRWDPQRVIEWYFD